LLVLPDAYIALHQTRKAESTPEEAEHQPQTLAERTFRQLVEKGVKYTTSLPNLSPINRLQSVNPGNKKDYFEHQLESHGAFRHNTATFQMDRAMWFKHLHLFRLHQQPTLDTDALEALLGEHRFIPVGKHEARRVGFSAPAGRHSEQLVHEIMGHRLLRLRRQERILPTAVVNDELEERCEAYEAAHGTPPARREKQAMKEKIVEELLPQAFTRHSHVDIWWDIENALIGVANSSRKRCEEVLDLLREALGSLKVTPLATRQPVSRSMTQWLKEPSSRPDNLEIGIDVELRGEDDSVLRARAIDPESDEIQSALASGRLVSKLSLAIDGELTFTLLDDLAIKNIKFDDRLIEDADEDTQDGDALVRMETEFALMSSTLSAFTRQLLTWLGGEATPGSAPWDQA